MTTDNPEIQNLTGNKDIDEALKEFEVKASDFGAKPIDEVMRKVPIAPTAPDAPKMVQLIMKWFGLKEQRPAEYILLGLCVVMIGISLFLFFGNGSTSNSPTLSPEELKNLPPELQRAIQNAK